MRIHILCVTRRPREWVNDASNEYLKRLRGQLEIVVKEIAPIKQSTASAQIEKEGERIRRLCPEHACVVALDETGEPWTTVQLAEKLTLWREQYADVACLIGGAEGLEPALLSGADHRWSLSRLTFPHQLARVILVEQLYRAWSVMHKHPYHRA